MNPFDMATLSKWQRWAECFLYLFVHMRFAKKEDARVFDPEPVQRANAANMMGPFLDSLLYEPLVRMG